VFGDGDVPVDGDFARLNVPFAAHDQVTCCHGGRRWTCDRELERITASIFQCDHFTLDAVLHLLQPLPGPRTRTMSWRIYFLSRETHVAGRHLVSPTGDEAWARCTDLLTNSPTTASPPHENCSSSCWTNLNRMLKSCSPARARYTRMVSLMFGHNVMSVRHPVRLGEIHYTPKQRAARVLEVNGVGTTDWSGRVHSDRQPSPYLKIMPAGHLFRRASVAMRSTVTMKPQSHRRRPVITLFRS